MTKETDLLLALDGGTGSFRAIVFNDAGKQIAISQIEWEHLEDPQYPGSMEFDCQKNWEIIQKCIRDLLSSNSISPEQIKGISTTSMREGFVLYDSNGKELIGFSNIDSRSEKEAVYFKKKFPDLELSIYKKTGQTFALSAIPRLQWIKNNEPEIYNRIHRINMLNDWIIYKLTGKIISEPSNSSTSGLFDIKEHRWLPEIASACGLKDNIFPQVIESGSLVGGISQLAAKKTGLSIKSQVICGGGDAQLGCIGLGVIDDNQAALFGGSFWQYEYNTAKPIIDEFGRIRINCHAETTMWQYEAIAWSAGLVMRWFRDAFLELDKRIAQEKNTTVYQLLDEKASKVPPGSHGMICTFADIMNFKNLKHAAPTFTNFAIDSKKFNKYTFYRSIMENAGLITYGHLKLIEELTGKRPQKIMFAGGSSYSPLWSQIIADILGIPVITPKEKEATALGAALLAGLGCGIYPDLNVATRNIQMGKEYLPNNENHKIYKKLFTTWQEIYKAQLALADQGKTKYMWASAGAE